MFAVYNVQGRSFRNSLEELRKVHAPTPGDRPGKPPDGQTGRGGTAAQGSGGKSQPGPNAEAVRTYRQTLNISVHEQVFHAHQIMSAPVSTLPMDANIAAAWQHFQQRDVRQVPVLDHRQQIVGLLSLENLLHYVITDGSNVRFTRGKTVKNAMTHPVVTADPVTDIRRIARLMQEYRLHAVPIVDERDLLVGLVSRTDILRTLANNPRLSLWA